MDDIQDQNRSDGRCRQVVEDDEINLLDYLRVVYKFRRMIIIICVVAVVTTAIVSLLSPKVYSATASVVPPLEILQQEPGIANRFGAMKSSILSDVISVTSIGNMYADILRSRAVVDALINRFDLMGVYDAEYQSTARKNLRDNTAIDVSDEGIVTVTVEDRDPNRAAAMANAYVEELDKQNKRLSSGQATSKRVFLESRLTEIEEELSNIENIPAKQAQIKEMLYELLARESELAKIEEAKSMPTIQVLDEAVVPETRMPRGTLGRTALVGLVSLVLAVFVAFARENFAKLREVQTDEQGGGRFGSGQQSDSDSSFAELKNERGLVAAKRKRRRQEIESYSREA